MKLKVQFAVGQVWMRPCPFIRVDDIGGVFECDDVDDRAAPMTPSTAMPFQWKPGTKAVHVGGGDYEDRHDGMGTQQFTIVAVVKLDGYQDRVLYTRKFTTPAGYTFGKNCVLMKSIGNFRLWCNGGVFRRRVDGAALVMNRSEMEAMNVKAA